MTLDSIKVVNNIEGKDDGPDTQVFYFRARAKSSNQLHFIRKRPWEGNDLADKERTFTITIE
jgi:hypothetical protein